MNIILSPYQNPPYRNPLRTATSQAMGPSNSASVKKMNTAAPPPSLQQSTTCTKRKRKDSLEFRPSCTSRPISPPAEPLSDAELSGANSPRSKVAERLQDLDLRQSRPVADLDELEDVPRKRLRQATPLRSKLAFHEECYTHFTAKPHAVKFAIPPSARARESVDEWNENYVKPDWPSSPPPERSEDQLQSELDPAASKEDSAVRFTARQLPTPPRPQTQPTSASAEQVIHDLDCPSRIPINIVPDRAALTWQDEEITGHEIDPLCADDDGEGINGIGFKPTPAMAYARRQRRRQQVSDWRLREAREARQKRMERRRGIAKQLSDATSSAAAADTSHGTNAGRVVRFAGVDAV